MSENDPNLKFKVFQNGVLVDKVYALNFTGAGVTASTNLSVASINIPSGGGGSGLGDPGTNGIVSRTALNTTAARTLTAGSSKVSIANGNGVSGNPTIDVVESNFTTLLNHAQVMTRVCLGF